MNMDMWTTPAVPNGRTSKMTASRQETAAVLRLTDADGNGFCMFGPVEAAEAFEKMAELFNEAHKPAPADAIHDMHMQGFGSDAQA
jgi:hypothetical protein